MIRITLLIALSCFYSAWAIASDGVSVTDAWIRLGPPNARVVSGYLNLQNTLDEDKILTRVASDQFSSIEIHLSRIENGVSKMIRKKQITIPAQGNFVLQPGSYHLMLFKPQMTLQEGLEIPLTFTFADGEDLTINATVKK